jgi:hypothetical protein
MSNSLGLVRRAGNGKDCDMQYLINVLHDSRELAPADEQAAIEVFNERMQADGHWVFAGGLPYPDAQTSTVFDNRAGAGIVTDGPFAESKEYAVGFWIVDVPSLEVARQLAAEGSQACNRRVELRPFLGGPR